MGIMKNAPNALIWTVGLCFLGVTGAFTALSITGSDTADLRAFMNTVLNIVAALFSGGALIVAGSAAHSAGKTQEQTNGAATAQTREIAALRLRLDEATRAITKSAIAAARATPPGPPVQFLGPHSPCPQCGKPLGQPAQGNCSPYLHSDESRGEGSTHG